MRKSFILVILLSFILHMPPSYCEDFNEREWDIYYTYKEYINEYREKSDLDEEEKHNMAIGMAAEEFAISVSDVEDVVSRWPEKPSALAEKVWKEEKNIPESASEEERNKRLREIERKYGITKRRREAMMDSLGWKFFFCEYYLRPLYGTCD